MKKHLVDVRTMGELRVIGTSPTLMVGDRIEGEIHITWSPTNVQEIAYAQKIFDKYLLKGWLAIGENAGSKTQIFRFDPSLEKIVLAPLMMGGKCFQYYCSELTLNNPLFGEKL